MDHCTWTPGSHLAVITRNGVIVLESPAEELGTQFWTLLEQGVDLGTLLQALTSACGTNLAALPNFVAIVPEADTMHIAVRGAFELSLDTQEGNSSFTSGNVITWEEKRVQQLNGWRINAPVDDADFSLSDPTELIAASAVIPVSTLSYGSLAATAQGNTTAVEQAPDVATFTESPAAPTVFTELTPVETDTDTPHETPEALSLPEVSAEEKAGYTLTEEFVDLTRAYAEEEDAEEDEDFEEDEAVAGEHLVDEQGLKPVEPQQDFSDLFLEHTRARSVEEAAVRQVRNDDNPYSAPNSEAPAAPAEVPTAVPESAPLSAAEATDVGAPYAPPPSSMGYTPPPPPAPPAPPAPPTPPEPEGSHHPQGFFIDDVPRANAAPSSQTPSLIDSVPSPGASSPAATPTASEEGFHDGHTVRSNKMAFLREQAQAMAQTPPTSATDTAGPLVVACLCIQGHPNPTHVQVCRTCEGAMTEQTVNIPRPPLGTLHVSTGEVITLDRDVVIGRRPSYTPQPGRPHAHVVLVPSPNQEISRTHCEIKIDGWDVRIRDLGSNNGTFLLRPGQSPVRVTDSAPMILRPGDILDLGDAVTVRMEA